MISATGSWITKAVGNVSHGFTRNKFNSLIVNELAKTKKKKELRHVGTARDKIRGRKNGDRCGAREREEIV